MHFQSIAMTDGVEPIPRLIETEAALLVIAIDRSRSSTRNCGAKEVTRGFIVVVDIDSPLLWQAEHLCRR
jgi:hypothetical protein